MPCRIPRRRRAVERVGLLTLARHPRNPKRNGPSRPMAPPRGPVHDEVECQTPEAARPEKLELALRTRPDAPDAGRIAMADCGDAMAGVRPGEKATPQKYRA